MIYCLHCNNNINKNCKYTCTDNDYRITDMSDSLINILSEHKAEDIPEEEKTNSDYVKYCSQCNFYYNYALNYSSDTNLFYTWNNTNINANENFLNDNIIHSFDNILCKYCKNNTLQKGYFEMEIVEETPENFINYSWANDFLKDINIFNESSSSLIKTITPSNYNDYVNLQKFTTSIGKKIIYCTDCNFFISNILEEFYFS